jgi:hypothetical protein
VADLSLDRHMLSEALRKKSEAVKEASTCGLLVLFGKNSTGYSNGYEACYRAATICDRKRENVEMSRRLDDRTPSGRETTFQFRRLSL